MTALFNGKGNINCGGQLSLPHIIYFSSVNAFEQTLLSPGFSIIVDFMCSTYL